VSDETERENLAKAEAWLARIVDGFRPPMETSMDKAATIQDEYDRLRAERDRLRPVVEAAEALVKVCDEVGPISMWGVQVDLLNPMRVLVKAVKEALEWVST
jgi:hypothetical protein